MTYSTIAVIYNPNSTGSSKDLAEDFVSQLSEKLPDQKVELIATERAAHAEELAYDLAVNNENPLIISSSGDGGYNEVVNGALKAQSEGRTVTTGLLPAGNANDHYHNLHDRSFIDSVVAGETRRIDVLKITSQVNGEALQRYAHSYIGIGLTPEVGHELNKTKLNFFKEVALVGRVLFKTSPVKLKINDRVRRYDSVIFSNIEKMSKYLTVSQESSVSDGKFELTIFRFRQKFKLIGVLLKASLVGLKEDQQVSEFGFETVNQTLVQADGEIITLDANAPVSIKIEQKLLSCIV